MKGHYDVVEDSSTAVNYVLRVNGLKEDEKPPLIVAGNLRDASPKEVIEEFRAIAKLRPGVRGAFLHFSLAVAAENLTRKTWGTICRTCLDDLQLNHAERPYLAVLHEKRRESRQDCHVVVSRVAFDGSLYDRGGWDVVTRFIPVCLELERKFGLRLTPGLLSDVCVNGTDRPDRLAPSHQVIQANRQRERLDLDPINHAKVIAVIEQCAAFALSMEEFIAAARGLGVEVASVMCPDKKIIKGLAAREIEGDYKFMGLSNLTGRRFSRPLLIEAISSNVARAAERAASVGLNAAQEIRNRSSEESVTRRDQATGTEVGRQQVNHDQVLVTPALLDVGPGSAHGCIEPKEYPISLIPDFARNDESSTSPEEWLVVDPHDVDNHADSEMMASQFGQDSEHDEPADSVCSDEDIRERE